MPTEPALAGGQGPSNLVVPSPAPVRTAGAVKYVPPAAATAAAFGWVPAANPLRPHAIDPAARAREAMALGATLYRQGQFAAALDRYADAVRLRPQVSEYHYKLACAAWKAGRPELVAAHFREAVRLDPRSALAHDGLGQWHLQEGETGEALKHSAAAVALDPGRGDFVVSHAAVLAAAGRADEAWKRIEPLVAAGPVTPALAVLYAQLAPKIGREAQAAAAVGAVAESPGLSAAERPQVHFAAAGLYDRLGRYDEAFAHARQANDAARRPHDPALHSEQITRLLRYFTPDRMRALPKSTAASRRPVFIVGMPRSGTSLVEQILASHPAVAGGGERTTLGRIAHDVIAAGRSEGDPFPDCLDALSVRRADRYAAAYLVAVDALAAGATFVTDKMPSNFLFLGLADLLLPGCRVIHCVRDPLDTCLSCYLTDFATGNEFSNDLGHLGAYYRDYRRLMDHWRGVINVPLTTVRYEDVVLDAEGQARRLLDFLDLPWDDRCLKFHENRRAVATASRDQVRRPLYASSVGRWKNYEAHLGPLLAALGGG